MTSTPQAAIPLPCPPGTKMLLEVAGAPDRLTAISVGHVKGRFVITSMPLVPEHNREALHQVLYADNMVIVRFLNEGTVMGFSAKLIRAIQVPFPLLFLTYPTKLESQDLRRHRRIPCCIPATLELPGANVQGMVVDMSLPGCQFSTSTNVRQITPPRVDDILTLRYSLFGQEGEIVQPCLVKRVAVSGKRLDIGLKFTELSEENKNRIHAYLHHVISVLE